MEDQTGQSPESRFDAAEITSLAHLYRGEMHQSKVWRTRIDATTNWAVVTTGIALSVTFSSADASPITMLLISWVIIAFLAFEARRYQIYDIYRIRVRVMEINFFGPILNGQGMRTDNRWNEYLAEDYKQLRFHVGYVESLGRRLRRNYAWLFTIQLFCYLGKIIIHPTPLDTLDQLWARAAIGPIPGSVALTLGVLFHAGWIALALTTREKQTPIGIPKKSNGPDAIMRVAHAQ